MDNIDFNDIDLDNLTTYSKIKYIHPNWVSKDQKPWLEDDVLMIPLIPEGLKLEAHPNWCEINDDIISDLVIQQENAISSGATSWNEYFEMQAEKNKSTISESCSNNSNNEFPVGLQIQTHPKYSTLNQYELILQQHEALKLNCTNWTEYINIKDSVTKYTQPQKNIMFNDVKPLIPLTSCSSGSLGSLNIHKTKPYLENPDEMGAITRVKPTFTPVNKSWDSYTKEDHQTLMNLYGSNKNQSDDEDPHGKTCKPFTEKNNYWEPHAWQEHSDNEYNVGMYDHYDSDPNSDIVFIDSDEEVATYNATKKNQQETTKIIPKNSETNNENIVQILERVEEVAVVMETLSGDSKEISKEIAELNPLIADASENINEIHTEIKKINNKLANLESKLNKLTTVESKLNKLTLSMESIESMLKTLVNHYTKTNQDSQLQ